MSFEFEITLHGDKELRRMMAGSQVIIDKRLTEAMIASSADLEGAILPLVPHDTGVLRDSIQSQPVSKSGSTIVGRVGSILRDKEYPKTMEFGRKPGSWISPEGMENLIDWVHRKRLAGRYSIKTGKRLGTRNKWNILIEDATVAGAIMMAIFARGIKGRHFMSRGYAAAKNKIKQHFHAALGKIIRDLKNAGNVD